MTCKQIRGTSKFSLGLAFVDVGRWCEPKTFHPKYEDFFKGNSNIVDFQKGMAIFLMGTKSYRESKWRCISKQSENVSPSLSYKPYVLISDNCISQNPKLYFSKSKSVFLKIQKCISQILQSAKSYRDSHLRRITKPEAGVSQVWRSVVRFPNS